MNCEQCCFCPFRKFQKPVRVRHHIARYHVQAKQFVCSGAKQLKVVAALLDYDQMRGVSSSTYLQKSAALLRDSIGCAITSQQNDIDRRVRLVLTGEGPVYRSLSSLGTTFNVKRVRNLYYEQSFADLVLQEMVLCNAKC